MLTEAEITNHIESLSKKYQALLIAINQTYKLNNQIPLDADRMTHEGLLFNPFSPSQPLTVKQINLNYRTLNTQYGFDADLTLINERSCPHENKQLLDSSLIHLKAISDGFIHTRNQAPHCYTNHSKPHSLLTSAINIIRYPILQAYLNIEEIIHNENLISNTISLSVAVLATWQGFMLGSLLATSIMFPPLVGMLCGSFFAASCALTFTKWAEKSIYSISETGSALATDHRFYLTVQEQPLLLEKNFDLQAVSEALRECAITMKSLDKTQTTFWHTPKIDLLKKVRELKAGYKEAQFRLNGKTFELLKHPQCIQEQEIYQPVEQYQNVASELTNYN